MMTATPIKQIAAPKRSKRSGPEPVEDHAPGKRASDEHARVGGQHPPEVRIGLEGGDESVSEQGNPAEQRQPPRPALSEGLPHQVGAADLGNRRNSEERY
jgi:hypothetical protein